MILVRSSNTNPNPNTKPMNKAYTSAQLRAMRTEQQPHTNHRAELRAWLRTAAEVISLALLAAALAFFLWI